jgi:Carboxypeptidase regulatory-like domain
MTVAHFEERRLEKHGLAPGTTEDVMKHWTLMLFVISVLLVGKLWAQSDRGSIRGTIVDVSGAVMRNVEVTATQTATGQVYKTVSNEQGLYAVMNLPIGFYLVQYEKKGFKIIRYPSVSISTAQVAQLDQKMEVGGDSERVEVTTDAPVLELQTSDVGTNMNGNVVMDLPLNIGGGRQIESFAFSITPGAQGDPYLAIISGTQGFTKEVVIDGTSQNASIQGDAIEASPSMEAIQELQAQTSGLSAERGITNGGVINFDMRSGTNQFHGSGYVLGHNEILDANTWSNGHTTDQLVPGSTKTAKAKARFWDYGFSAGGPIISNKTFVFGALERFSQNDFTLGGDSQTVPTTAFLNGDFSSLLNTNVVEGVDGSGNTIYKGAIFDPATGNVFLNNHIPTSRFSNVSKQIVGIYQQYYKPDIESAVANNRSPISNSPSQTPVQVSVKGDHEVTNRDHLNGSYIYNHRPRTLNDSGGIWSAGSSDGGPLSHARIQRVLANSWRVSESHTFSNTVLNVFNVTWNNYTNGSLPTESASDWPSKLGIGSGFGSNFPSIDFGSRGPSLTGVGNSWQGNWVANTFIYDDTVSWVHGRHSLKFGAEMRTLQLNSHAGQGTLHFTFNPDYTGAPSQSYAGDVGYGFASFLLGGVDKASVDTPFNLYGRRKIFSFFGQDDLRVNSKLTLNLGLRYQINNPLHEKNGHWANFNPTAMNPAIGIPGVMEVAKDGSDSFERNRDWRDLGPTLGFAYSPAEKWVVRGGFGIYYAPIGINYWNGIPYGFAPGYRGTNEVTPVGPGQAAFNWDNGYPGSFQPGSKDPNYFPSGTVAIDPNALKAGYTEQFNIGAQYEMSKNTRLSVSYVGNRGHRLHDGALSDFRPDAATFLNLFKNGTAYNWVYDAASAAASGVPYPYAGFGGFAFQAINPFPQVDLTYGPIYAVDTPKGNSAYNSLQVELTKRTGNGLTLDFNYVLSKSTGNTTNAFGESWYYSFIQDPKNLKEAADTLTRYDQKHVFKGYLAYDLPLGRGKRLLSGAGGALNHLVGGWTLGTVVRYNTGQPLSFYSQNYYFYPDWTITYMNFAPGVKRTFGGSFVPLPPTTAANPNSAIPSQDRYFDPTLITDPAYGDLGKGPASIDALRGFGKAYENASIIKYFSMGERYKLQLRVEFYNIFNRHYLADPNTNPASQYFGYVTGATNDPPRQGQFGARFTW